jgi:hypothetical protein
VCSGLRLYTEPLLYVCRRRAAYASSTRPNRFAGPLPRAERYAVYLYVKKAGLHLYASDSPSRCCPHRLQLAANGQVTASFVGVTDAPAVGLHHGERHGWGVRLTITMLAARQKQEEGLAILFVILTIGKTELRLHGCCSDLAPDLYVLLLLA